jgi:hypothetical protein
MSSPHVFGLTQSLRRFDTDSLYVPPHRNDERVETMTKDRAARLAIAERIAEAEHHVTQLRERVERLRNEGSDAAQAQETLQVVSRNLANLYIQQAVLRRTVWAWHSTKAG